MVLLSVAAFSQDLVVTKGNDTINCKILKIEDGFLRFLYINRAGDVKNINIPYGMVNLYGFSYFETPAISEKVSAFYKELKWQVAFRGGYSWRTVRLYGDKNAAGLKNGIHAGFDFAYFFNNYVGMGGKINYYHNQLKNSVYDITQNAAFAGPDLVFRIAGSNRRNVFVGNLSAGYFGLIEHNASTNNGIKGNIGYLAGVGCERMVTSHFSIGGKFSLLLANIPDAKVNGSRIDVSIYMAFNSCKK